jgi:hypothetical protein
MISTDAHDLRLDCTATQKTVSVLSRVREGAKSSALRFGVALAVVAYELPSERAADRAPPPGITAQASRFRDATFCYASDRCTVRFPDAGAPEEFVCGSVILRLHSGTRIGDVADIWRGTSATIFRDHTRWEFPWVQLSAPPGTERELLVRASNHRHVRDAQLDIVREPELRR